MKKAILMVLFAMLLGVGNLQAQNAMALFSYSTFNDPNGTPYIETYVSFNAWHFKFIPTAGSKYQATIEMTVIATRDDSIVYAKRYNLQSPAIDNPENNMFSFLDVLRFAIPNGIYNLQIVMKDKNGDTDPVEINQNVTVYYPADKPSLSTLQIIASAKPTKQESMISRNGYDMEPYVDSYIPKEIDLLNFYYEIYNVQKEISELRNRHNETFGVKKYTFQRSNPNVQLSTDDMFVFGGTFVTNIDEKDLNYYIQTLYPTASAKEKDFIFNEAASASLEEKQAFFYKFWLARSTDPKSEWFKYRKWVEYVDKHFSKGNVRGYQSDRGRVYLQYGPPTYVLDEKNKVSTRNFQNIGHIHYLPYQMWFYEYIPGDNPKRAFVFFDQFRSGNYYLLHSNAKGEVQDMFWERRLSGNQLEENMQAEAGVQFERGY